MKKFIDHIVALYRTCMYLQYIHMYVHTLLYNACSATPFLEYTDIATYTGLVYLALLLKPQTLFTILVNYAYAC